VATEIYERVCRHIRRHGRQIADLPLVCGRKELYHLFPYVVLLDPEHQGDGSVVTIANGKTGGVCYVSPYARDGMAVMAGAGKAKLVPLADAPSGEAVLEALLDEWRGAIEEHQVFSDLLDLVMRHGRITRQAKTKVICEEGAASYVMTVYEFGPYFFVVETCGEAVDPRLALHLVLMRATGAILYAGPASPPSLEAIAPEIKARGLQVEGIDDPPIDADTVRTILDEVSRIVHPPSSEVSEGSV